MNLLEKAVVNFGDREMLKFIAIVQATLILLTMHSTPTMAAEADLTHSVIRFPGVRVASPWSRIIYSQAEWDTFYRESTFPYNGGKNVIVPEIDFAKNTVVAGGLGSAYSASEVMVRRVIGNGDTLNVGIVVLTPGQDCLVGQMIDYPTIALLIPTPNAKIAFGVSQVVQNCK